MTQSGSESETTIEVKTKANFRRVHALFAFGYLFFFPITFLGEDPDLFIGVGFAILHLLTIVVAGKLVGGALSGTLIFHKNTRALTIRDGFNAEGSSLLTRSATELIVPDGMVWLIDRIQLQSPVADQGQVMRFTPSGFHLETCVRLMLLPASEAEAIDWRQHQQNLSTKTFENRTSAPIPESAKCYMSVKHPTFLTDLAQNLSQVTGARVIDMATQRAGGAAAANSNPTLLERINARQKNYPLLDPNGWAQLGGVRIAQGVHSSSLRLRGQSPLMRAVFLSVFTIFIFFLVAFFEESPVLWSALIFFAGTFALLCLDDHIIFSRHGIEKKKVLFWGIPIQTEMLLWTETADVFIEAHANGVFSIVFASAFGTRVSVNVIGEGKADWLLCYAWDWLGKNIKAT